MSKDLSINLHPLRRRLWKVGGLMALFTATLLAGNTFLPANRAVTRDMLGHDFLAFYAAGTMAREGRFGDLYDLSAIKKLESSVGHANGMTTGFGPYWNPPFVAWFFAPFSMLQFGKALLLWEMISAAALIVSIVLMSRWLPKGGDWRNWGLVALLILTSNPLIAVFTHAQNTCLTLLLMTIVVTFWRNGKALAAGLVCGLLLYKPQHAPILAAALLVCLGWRTAAGLAITSAALALATIFTMPGAATDYLHKLPQIALTMQEQSRYAWDRHVTLKAFWRLLFQGTDAGPTDWPAWLCWWGCELIVAATLARRLWRARQDTEQASSAMATTIAAGTLLALFCFDYDLLILAIPAVLCAAESMRRGTDRRLLIAWIVLFVALHLGTYLTRPTHFNLATPALAAVVVCLSRRRKTASADMRILPPAPLPVAA